MKKLYTQPILNPVSLENFSPVIEQSGLWPAEEEFQQLENCVQGYCNAGALYDSVATETYTLVDNKNIHLYNAYTELLADKLGVSMPSLKQVTTASLESLNVVTVNSEIALEGWISNLWNKIKGLFIKMYEGVKSFFKKYFTRLGRTKNALENLKLTLEKTDKNLVKASLDNYTGSLLKRYSGYSVVNASNVKKSLSNVSGLTSALNAVNKTAEKFANKHMVDKEFFTKLKSLKDLAASSDSVKQEVDDNTPGKLKSLVNSKSREDRKDKLQESATLAEVSKQAKSESSSMDTEVTTLSSAESGDIETNAQLAKKDMAEFMEDVKKALDSSINSKLVSGKVIKRVEVNDTFDLEVEMDDSDDPADSINLGTRSDLLDAVKKALEMINSSKADVDNYGKINDTIINNLSTVDSLISDIDRIDPEKYGKYKKLVNEQIRERLTMLRKFFSAYNKVGKNIFDLTIDTCEGVVDYSVTSLKNFG